MGIKAANSKIIDLRKAPKDIVDSFRNSGDLGAKIEALGRVKKRLVGLLRSNILKR